MSLMKDFMPHLRRTAVIVCSILFAILAVRNLVLFAISGYISYENLVIGIFLFGLSYAVFREYRWSLRAAAIICVFLAIILPIGLLNPFTAGDYLASGGDPPSVAPTLLWLVPADMLLLAVAFIVDPKKKARS